jgi:hypothetical protein
MAASKSGTSGRRSESRLVLARRTTTAIEKKVLLEGQISIDSHEDVELPGGGR